MAAKSLCQETGDKKKDREREREKRGTKPKGKAATIMCLMHKSKTHLKLNRSIQQITKQSSAARGERKNENERGRQNTAI